MREPRIADAAARRAIAEDLHRNYLVEAAAGTGKTTSLIGRMVAVIREGRAPIEKISAVTFTVAAAAELTQRFRLALEAARREERDPRRRERLEAALRGRERCFIGTIHAFCARLLRERPIEAGVDPEFVEMEETENVLRRGEAWDRYTARLFSESSDVLPQLAELGVPLEALRSTYERLADNEDVRPADSPIAARPDIEFARAPVLEFLDAVEKELPASIPENGWDDLQRRVRSALQLRRVCDLSSDPAFVTLLECLDHGGKVTQNRWRNAARAKQRGDEHAELRRTVIRPALERWREFLYPIVIAAIEPAVADFRARRLGTAHLNFQDLLILARDLLRTHPDVRRELQERHTPLFVDEFQDTDPIQAEVMLYLTGADAEERDWRRLAPLPGTLFVVGDPKQSIYRFRRADIEIYGAVKRSIAAAGGGVLELTTNFRSSEQLCAWTNEVFSILFPDRETREQAAHVALDAVRPRGGAGSGVFRLDVPDGPATFEAVAGRDAERIASWIGAALDGGLPVERRGADGDPGATPAEPGDFLILTPFRHRLRVYARALESRGIPYEISGGGAFADSEELAALLDFLDALVDPDDPVPLVAALRGPLFGVDDRSLYLFAKANGRFHSLAPLPSGTDERIRRAWEMLRESRDLVRRLPPAAAFARIADRLRWIADAASKELGGTRAGNLLKAATVARRLSNEGRPFAEIVRQLRRLTEQGETEEMTTEPGRPHAVRLMNLHRAKGLEAPIVFLADPTADWREEADCWIDRDAEEPQGYFPVVKSQEKRGGGSERVIVAQPTGWSEMAEVEKRFVAAERLRLLYVAATRAGNTLVVSSQTRDGAPAARGAWKRFLPFLRHPLGDVAAARRAASGLPAAAAAPVAAETLEDFRDRRRARAAAAAAPSLSVTSVTRIAHAAVEETPFASRTGRGMSWGRVIHRLLEGSMRDPALDLRTYAANLLAEEERPEGDAAEAVRLVEAVRASPLWARARRARRTLVEVPFALTVASAELGSTEGPPETLLTGAVDLVFEEDGGWVLVDYKSDTIDGNREALVRFYSKQIEIYRRFWSELTKRPTRAGLFFVQTGEEVWL
jgi:ATP-dependent helicase/nuclease subunit A